MCNVYMRVHVQQDKIESYRVALNNLFHNRAYTVRTHDCT